MGKRLSVFNSGNDYRCYLERDDETYAAFTLTFAHTTLGRYERDLSLVILAEQMGLPVVFVGVVSRDLNDLAHEYGVEIRDE